MDTIEELKRLIEQEFGIEPGKIAPDEPFAAYDLDSLTLAELVFAIEDHFHVIVQDEAVGSLATLRDVAQMLDALLTAKRA